jgi:hypothetical protein
MDMLFNVDCALNNKKNENILKISPLKRKGKLPDLPALSQISAKQLLKPYTKCYFGLPLGCTEIVYI